MPEFVSKPEGKQWSVKVRCAVCKYVYRYFAHDLVVGEDVFEPDRPCVYCGNCNAENFVPANKVPKKVIARARRY